ncbi:hypothetical protein PT300_15465 [Enterobacteriaceae bacterium ESL0689]|nr:hypothetical protein [Enterobacteriaceae bacterium ESL0689]MDF7681899.1 hypothetical protein [Enterobacteriaceae bacterium ESL0689]
MNNTEKLIAVGELLYGKNWQSPAARALGISYRTIRNYVSGKTVPARISSRLLYALRDETEKIQAAADLVNSDRITRNEMTTEKITEITDRYNFPDWQSKQAAIDEIRNAVSDENWISDFEEIARKWANADKQQ